jgi:hypothetical protein
MFCDFARNLDASRLEQIEALERDLGLTIVAFSCRSLDPDREERLRRAAAELGPLLQATPAAPDDAQLGRIREAERTLGLALVAVRG